MDEKQGLITLPVPSGRPRIPPNVLLDDGVTIVWVALRCWPLQVLGAFATEQEAYDVCETTNDVIGPMEIGKELTGDCDWVGAYYPLVKVGSDGRETTQADGGETGGGESGEKTAE